MLMLTVLGFIILLSYNSESTIPSANNWNITKCQPINHSNCEQYNNHPNVLNRHASAKPLAISADASIEGRTSEKIYYLQASDGKTFQSFSVNVAKIRILLNRNC